MRRWLQAPREFRPDTRMPHFYNLSNNHPDVLPADQKKFPDAEIHSIAYYLFRESADYVQGKDRYLLSNRRKKDELEEKQKNNLISDQEKIELEEVKRRLEYAKPPVPIQERILTGDGQIVKLPSAPQGDKEKKDQLWRGRKLFTEKGCLACHSHAGTTVAMAGAAPADNLPKVTSVAQFAPKLSQLAAKINPENGDPDAKRRWLVQWILNPNIHFPRTRMPYTHLSVEQAADVAAWLLDQQPTTRGAADPEIPSEDTLEKLAQIHLQKSLGEIVANEVLQHKGLSDDQAKHFREQGSDADELRLAPGGDAWPDKLKWYIGRKAITALGCFGCHDIPGFELAKPIGTPLNDWGKKDPERLAFEDVVAYVKAHNNVVPQRTDSRDPSKPAVDWRGKAENGQQKGPYEQYFFDALEHHQREGFLHQKLMEPRSYDYHRVRKWEDRLRMPQFGFSRTAVPSSASEEEKAQAEKEEAEAREDVMTFILGLIAEPIPLKYVYSPAPERLAEAKGIHVLDKFNCAGCHQLRPGRYEFKANTPKVLASLESAYNLDRSSSKSDDPFPGHNAWTGQASANPDRIALHGLPVTQEKESMVVKLNQAVRFTKKKTEDSDLAAGTYDISAAVRVEELPMEDLLSRTEPHGGRFVELMVPYLVERKAANLDDDSKARSGLPPPLVREGEKVQPSWLFQFLRNPQPIRPQRTRDAKGTEDGVVILRMPRFNMSDDDAMTLVNYFAAVDRRENPGIQLNAPYLAVPQRDEEYLAALSAEYVARLGKEETDKRLEKLKELVDKEPKTPGGPPSRSDLERHLYSTDAYRLLANYELCLNCHQVGSLEPKTLLGPSLMLSPERLRPDWTQRWIASPQRLLIYPAGNHTMPQNFPRDNPQQYQDKFMGDSLQKATAVRDILMILPRVVDLPGNRTFRPSLEGVK
jgi:mono/diheme cytochrome c family protein